MNEQPDSSTITVKFNKKQRTLSAGQAAEYAQKGLKYEQLQPALERLKLAAARQNVSLGELLESVCEEKDNAVFTQLLAKAQGNEQIAQQLMELENRKADTRITQLEQLREAFPEIMSPEQLPERAAQIMDEQNIAPLDALLRYNHEQQLRAKSAIADNESAQSKSAGELRSEQPEDGSGEINALLEGIWG